MGRKKKDGEKIDGAPTCPNDHALERRVAADGDYECDVCNADICDGSCFFGCTPCDYSLCNGCYIKVATGEIKVPQGDKSELLPEDCITGQRIDPDVAELCEHFTIEDRIMLKLNEVMRGRKETFAGDMEKLWDELTNARSAAGLLMAKIRQIQEGTFVGKNRAPASVQKLIDRYRLDTDARTKLTGFMCSRPATMEQDLFEIERRCETSNNPSATVMMMIVKMAKGEKLPEPLKGTPHRDFAAVGVGGGGGGCGREDRGGSRGDRDRGDRGDDRGGDRGDRGDRGRGRGSDFRERDRDGERDRDRDRDRDRGRSRSRGDR